MNTFKLEIITPEREIYEGDAAALTFCCTDGEITVLKGHIPMFASLAIGELHIRDQSGVKIAFHSEGFVEVRPDEVLVFTQACEWADEIDVHRAESARDRALQKLNQKGSELQNHHSAVSLTRAMTRIKLSKKR